MGKVIDCLLIGHNEMNFEAYEQTVRQMGVDSGAYRDLCLNFIQMNNKLYTAGDAFNYFCHENNALNNSMSRFSLGNLFSLTIAYLGSFLNKHGFTFDFVNSFQDDQTYLKEVLQNSNIRTIAILTTLYVTSFPILEIVSFIKQYNKEAKIIIGGPFVATQLRSIQDKIHREYFLKTFEADIFINSSQGEKALVDTINALKNGLSLDGINNIIYKYNNKYIINQTSIEDNRLEENPVDWGLFKDRVGRSVAIRTSISCPFSCAFCGFPQHAGKYQTASIEHIERELNSIQALGKVTNIIMIDDTLNVPTSRFKEMLRMIIKNKYDFNWSSYFRCQFTDAETAFLMKESRCQGVFLGIESGSDTILRNMNKTATVDQYKHGISLLNNYDIVTYGSFIIGFPGETEETVAETVRLIEEYQPVFFRTQSWYCEPITPIYQQREEYQIKGSQFSWSHSTMNAHTAGDIINKIFLSIKNSTWLPQYSFEFFSFLNLLDRGMTVKQSKRFFNAFNDGIKERLTNPAQKEISPEVLGKFRNIFTEDEMEMASLLSKTNDVYNVDFDF